MKLLDSKLSHLTKKNFEFRSINSSVSLKLDELRKKIMRAKQAASSVMQNQINSIKFIHHIILVCRSVFPYRENPAPVQEVSRYHCNRAACPVSC